MKSDEKVFCEVPTPGKVGTNIPRWKYELVRDAILTLLDEHGEQGILFKELPEAVKQKLPEKELAELGSVTWHVTTVKLDLETKGLIRKAHNKSPQRLVLT